MSSPMVMPYGAAPAWCFPVYEIAVVLLFACCIVHASRLGAAALSYLLGSFCFGLLLEYVEVVSGSYTYGTFFLMLGRAPASVPVCAGVGWGIIMYTARLLADALRLPPWSAAALDALLALNIDGSIDVVAYRLHMWTWPWAGTGLDPLRAQWFGIPWGNFVGWATVVFCYSASSRLLERWLGSGSRSALRVAVIALLALLVSQAILMATEAYLFPVLRERFHMGALSRFLLILAVLLVIAAVGLARRREPRRPIPQLSFWVPGWFHLFFLFCFVALGFWRENPALTAATGANVLVGVAAHAWPWLAGMRRRSGGREALIPSPRPT